MYHTRTYRLLFACASLLAAVQPALLAKPPAAPPRVHRSKPQLPRPHLPKADRQTAQTLKREETIGGGTVESRAIGPPPSFGIGGKAMVLVKNWHFGTKGTIQNRADMNANFFYHDQFGTIGNGTNYGAVMVAPDTANALPNQPVEGVNSPPVRKFTADSLQTFLTPLNGAMTVDPKLHNAGSGSFMAKTV